jgi:hypothetical protein
MNPNYYPILYIHHNYRTFALFILCEIIVIIMNHQINYYFNLKN